MKKLQIQIYWLIGLIMVLGLILRVINISTNPRAMYGDELAMVYDVYSIIQTGRDQHGEFLPLTFKTSDGRPPGYVYFSIPFVLMFGPTAEGIRALSIISGVLLIGLVYLISRELRMSTRIAIAASVLVAISPWDLSLSRGGFEAHFGLALASAGVYFFLKSGRWLALSALLFGLSILTYHSFKLTVPIIIGMLFWYTKQYVGIFNNLRKKGVNISIFGLILGIFLLIWISQINKGSDNRFSGQNIFVQENIDVEIEQSVANDVGFSAFPSGVARLFHNKAVEYGFRLGSNYLDNLSLNFLFLRGDGNPRHNVLEMGGLYSAQLILLIIGGYKIFQRDFRSGLLLGGWVLISPLATMFVSGAHGLRSNFMIIPLAIISGVGLTNLNYKKVFEKIVLISVVLGISVQFLFVIERLYFLSADKFASFWSQQTREIVEYVRGNNGCVIISSDIDNIDFGYFVYAKVDPKKVQAQVSEERGGVTFRRINNVLIGSIKGNRFEFLERFYKGCIYVDKYRGESGVEHVYDNRGSPFMAVYR